jgi:branched-chain amino acid transport system substrate-binding protein
MNFAPRTTAIAIAAAAALSGTGLAQAQAKELKIGMLLPLSQVFAVYGQAVMEGFNLALEEAGGQAAGMKVVLLSEDNKEDPKTTLQLVRKYIKDENVDFLVGPIASHVVAAIRDDVHRAKTFLVVPNAGNNDVTGKACSPYIIRTSFSNWQINYPMGLYAAESVGKSAFTVGANYDAGREMAGAFAQGFQEKGGKAPIEEWPALGTSDFAPTITNVRGKAAEIDTVWAFMPGGSTPRFINQVSQSGLRSGKLKLSGPVFMADELFFPAMGDAAIGVLGSGHYVSSIDTPRNQAFQAAFRKKYNKVAHVVHVQGYDTAKLILATVSGLKGDLSDKDKVRKFMTTVQMDSPRGKISIDPKTGNVVQNVYITEVIKRADGTLGHKVLKTYDQVADKGEGCQL